MKFQIMQTVEKVLAPFSEEGDRSTRREFLLRAMRGIPLITLVPLLLDACGNGSGSSGIPGGAGNAEVSCEITFSKRMNTASVIDSISIQPSPLSQPRYEWKNNDSVLYLSASVENPGMVYQVTVGAGAQDSVGVALDCAGGMEGGCGFSLESA